MLHGARAWAYMDNRSHVVPEDLQAVLPAVVAHRLTPSGTASGVERNDLVAHLLQQVAIP
jgi:MoxR-like ATPase